MTWHMIDERNVKQPNALGLSSLVNALCSEVVYDKTCETFVVADVYPERDDKTEDELQFLCGKVLPALGYTSRMIAVANIANRANPRGDPSGEPAELSFICVAETMEQAGKVLQLLTASLVKEKISHHNLESPVNETQEDHPEFPILSLAQELGKGIRNALLKVDIANWKNSVEQQRGNQEEK